VTHILITGGAGFLGSHVCDALLARGDHVTCIDNYITGDRSNLEHLFAHDRFTLIEHDIRRPFEAPANFDVVMHLASPASPPAYLAAPIETLEVGSIGTRNALEIARTSGAAFLLTSTSEVYGDPEVSPQPETYRGSVSTTGPRSVYDESKRYAEALTMAYHRTHGIDTRIVRIFNTYGPRLAPGDGRAIPNFIKQALQGIPLTVYGDGTQTRSFCYVEDMVRGIIALLGSSETEPVNIGSPDERTILQVAKLVIEKTDSSSGIEMQPLPTDDPLQRRPDISKAREVLGWEPSVDLSEGLDLTIEWFRSALHTT
jgi:nucleoside-diphosphate-sugar epimerase